MSIKNGDVGEVHRFVDIEGEVDENGNVMLSISLDSVDTGVQIRDERMRSLLFETNLFPTASFSAQVGLNKIQAMEPGESRIETVKGRLKLHGVEKGLEVELLITRLTSKKMMVTSLKPVTLNAAEFSLAEGVERLRKVAELSGISMAVPMNFVMTFEEMEQ